MLTMATFATWHSLQSLTVTVKHKLLHFRLSTTHKTIPQWFSQRDAPFTSSSPFFPPKEWWIDISQRTAHL